MCSGFYHLLCLLSEALISKMKNIVGSLAHSVNLTLLWHLSCEARHLEMLAVSFICYVWTSLLKIRHGYP